MSDSSTKPTQDQDSTQSSKPAVTCTSLRLEEDFWDYNYVSRKPGDLGRFFKKIDAVPMEFRFMLPTKVISFHLPQDSLASSGIIEELGIKRSNLKHDPPTDERDKYGIYSRRAIAAQMVRQVLLVYGHPDKVPLARVFPIYGWMLQDCENVETIEIPGNWAGIFRWRTDKYFPKVNPADWHIVGRRVRWGPSFKIDDQWSYYWEEEREVRLLQSD